MRRLAFLHVIAVPLGNFDHVRPGLLDHCLAPQARVQLNSRRRLHAIEVETTEGFDLRSVYQAHAQGRDAHYSWVFGNKAPGVEKSDWSRVLWTAEELGVGLVTFTKPHAYGTWTTHRKADHKEPTLDEREMFLERTMSTTARAAFDAFSAGLARADHAADSGASPSPVPTPTRSPPVPQPRERQSDLNTQPTNGRNA